MRVIRDIRQLNSVICYHVGFIPYRPVKATGNGNNRGSNSEPSSKPSDEPDIEVLLADKRGQIGIVGGGAKTSKKETVLQALQRELKEELNLEIDFVSGATSFAAGNASGKAPNNTSSGRSRQSSTGRKMKLDVNRLTAMLFDHDDAVLAERRYSVLLWYHDSKLENYLVFNSANKRADEELAGVTIYPSWQALLWQTDLSYFTGAADWAATPLARVLAMRNLEFFGIDNWSDMITVPSILSQISASKVSHNKVSHNHEIYPELNFTKLYPWREFLPTTIDYLIQHWVDNDQVSYLTAELQKLTTSTAATPTTAANSQVTADEVVIDRIMLIPYTADMTVWLFDPNQRNNKGGNQTTGKGNSGAIVTNTFLPPDQQSFLYELASPDFNQVIKELKLSVLATNCVIHEYGGEQLGLVYLKLAQPPGSRFMAWLDLTKIEEVKGCDLLAWKMLRRTYDLCRYNAVSPVSRLVYPATFVSDSANNSKVAAITSTVSLDNMFVKDALVERFRQQHRQVVAELLEDRDHYELPGSYLHNVLKLDVVNIYLQRQHPLLQIFDSFIDGYIDINDTVAAIVTWCSGQGLWLTNEFDETGEQGELSLVSNAALEAVEAVSTGGSIKSTEDNSDHIKVYIDVDLYYTVRDKLKSIAEQYNLQTTDYSRFYFDFRVY